MGTTADKLNRLINTKEGIRQELNRAYETEEISTSDTFSSYIQKLEEHPFYLKGLVEGTIESIKLSNVISIGEGAFSSCSSLTEVSFPKVTSIGQYAFYRSNLTTIYVGTESDTVCTLSSTTAIPSSVTDIYVPKSLVDSYKSATNWVFLADLIKAYEQPVG